MTHDEFALVVVGIGKESASDERRAEDVKKIGRCHAKLSCWSFAGGGNPALDVEASRRCAAR